MKTIDFDNIWILEANGYSLNDLLFFGTEREFEQSGIDADLVKHRITGTGYTVKVYIYLSK